MSWDDEAQEGDRIAKLETEDHLDALYAFRREQRNSEGGGGKWPT